MEPGSPTSKILYPEWQAEYQAALLELDPKTLFEWVTAAETAIFNRLQAMSHNSDGNTERQAIEDALAALRVLKRDTLGKVVRITRPRGRAKREPCQSEQTHAQTWRP
jgi:hypothetical protein